ncbi:HCO3 transporter family-domain-containing protein [Lipomyces kononenkoae]|uniref:HCO3 transporter family-domain-containing protein n=1 Tax=Lipomyces kononenkoae TaxID=34357 RepID=A0ACC3T895_LIPKO
MSFTIFGIHAFRGMRNDIKNRLPYYLADWTVDAWNYRIIPATIYMYFANVLPAIAFALDMFSKTHSSYGVNEVLLASVLGALLFSVFAGQPLCIVGVTGPISVFNYTVYEIITPRGTPYFAFMSWICLWSMVMHFAIAIANGVKGLRYITRFSCDIFGFYVAFIYLQKGIQVLTRQFGQSSDIEGFISIMVALLVLMFGYMCHLIGDNSTLFWRPVRRFLADYGTPLVVIFFTGFIHIGKLRNYAIQTLPTTASFHPTASGTPARPHGWFIHFWDGISVGDVFLALPFAVLLTILFYFDHNVSSLICQGKEFPLKKPGAFHWDFFLLGLSTGIAGILGIPAPNGLIPQAPFHTMSLCVHADREKKEDDNDDDNDNGRTKRRIKSVIEQRVSNFAHGLLILGTMTGPLLIVLGLVPQAVLAGLFWIMGLTALQGNGIVLKLYYLCQDRALTSRNEPLRRVRLASVYLFAGIELVAFGCTFATTQTIAAVGFPAILLLFAGLPTLLLPRIFDKDELNVLDEPTASDVTMAGVVMTGTNSNSSSSSSVVQVDVGNHLGPRQIMELPEWHDVSVEQTCGTTQETVNKGRRRVSRSDNSLTGF